MSNDRELLEKAAKAAGIDLQPDPYSGLMWVREKSGDRSGPVWNPLADDGDALRLAVKMGLQVDCMRRHGTFVGYGPTMGHSLQRQREAGENVDGKECPYAATRRAVVRAAAAMADQEEREQ